MNAPRHRKIGELYHGALDVAPERRADFLRTACAGDEELLQDVQSLLAAHDEAGEFIDTPAIEGAAAALAHGALASASSSLRQVGPYTLVSLLGRGGMGEVYRAHDARLGRDVAIKILPEQWALDVQHRSRFQREARALASLNHPNIAALYGIEHTAGGQALVMELIEGVTLAERIESGPIPIREVMTIAPQIAEALEAAHEQGIIHRDLKPANITVRPDGTVKVLDFGLAKALEPGGREGAVGSITARSAVGSVLGTAAYMSPEQARGGTVDRRTDVWAFGCVLYEMLTGQRAFAGDSVSEVIARIIEREPDFDALPAATPPAVRLLLRRCLQKNVRDRLRHIGDAVLELRDLRAADDIAPNPPSKAAAANGRLWLAAGVIVTVIALTLTAATWLRPRAEAPAGSVHMTALLPPGVSVTRGPGRLLSLALAPDGRTLLIAGTDANGQRLYERALDRPEATPLAGTEGGSSPFFSPDGAWIGFFADGWLKRVPAGGGAAVDITVARGFPAGASWGIDGRIVFAAGKRSPLWVVDARGGTPEPVTTPDAGLGHLFPEVLPDGRTLLFNEDRWIHAIDLASGRRTAVVEGRGPRYASGHLILSRGTTLLAAPFDVARLELTGPVVPVVEGVAVETSVDAPHVATSRIGTLAYVPAARTYALVLVEPDGTERLLSEALLLQNPRFSPSGQRLVVATTRREGDTPDLWMHDLQGASPASRLTFDGGRAAIWTPDGAAVTYSHPVPSERSGIYTAAADGSGDARQIVRLPNFHWLVGWTPKRTLAYGMMEDVTDGISRSSILAMEGSESRRVVGPGDTWGGRLSPDGHWLAYYSLDSGYFEVYVTPFPDTGARWLIAEGTDPAWSPDGSEIFYRTGSRLMAARIDTESGVRVLSRRLVIEPFSPPLYDDYDIHPDGRTLALVRPAGDAQGREITIVLNWLAELRRLMRQ